MTIEEVKYYSILLGVGEFEEFRVYLDELMNSSKEIDDLEADLIFESQNYSKCCDILTKYYSNKSVDDCVVASKLISFVKNKLENNKITSNGTIKLLVKFSKEANKLTEDKLVEPWVTMKLLGLLLDPSNTIILESDLDNFLNKGITLTEDTEFQKRFNQFMNNSNNN